MSRVLVTGGAGFIGSHIVDALVGLRHRVTVVDDLSTGRRDNVSEGVELVREDIRSPRMKDVFRDFSPEYVFHLAAQKNVHTSIDDPLFDADVNITGSLNIIEQSRRFAVKKCIFSSTGGALYGDGVRLPTPETVPARPESPYGIAKYTIEQYLRFYREHMKLPSIALRYANVYGPRQDPRGEAGVIAIFAERLLRGESLQVNGTGRQTRDYVYVADVVRANVLAMKNPKAVGEFNIGTGRPTTVNTLASTLMHIAGQRVSVAHRRAVSGEVMKSALSSAKAKKILRWKPEVTLPIGLRETWTWAKATL